jgi:hypothetical protein
MSTSDDPAFRRIEFDRIYTFRVGGIPVVFGQIAAAEVEGPAIIAAALSEADMRRESCGYGASEAEAVADLFRLMR